MRINLAPNFQEFIPVKNTANTWDTDNNIVTIHVVNKGFYNMIAQRFFDRPQVSHIKLDKYGSYVWQCINDRRRISEISQIIYNEYGKEIEPVSERLEKYFRSLYENKLIFYKK